MQYIPGWMMFRAHNRPINFALVFAVALAADGFDFLRYQKRFSLITAKVIFGACVLLALFLAAACGEEFWRKLLTSRTHTSELYNPNPAARLATLRDAVSHTRYALLATLTVSSVALILVLFRKRVSGRVWQWSVIIVAVLDMVRFAVPVKQFKPDLNIVPPNTAEYLAAKRSEARSAVLGMMNEGTTHEIPSIEGNDIVVTRYYNTFLCSYLRLDRIMPTMSFQLQGESPLLDAANLVYVAMDPKSPAALSGIMPHEADLDTLSIYRRPNALPRAYVVGSARWIADNDAAHHAALMDRVDFRQEVLLAGTAPASGETTKTFDAIPATVEYKGLHEVRIKSPARGWLVLADGYYPHWKATTNGQPAQVLRANSAFRAVYTQKDDEVVYRYQNPAFALGAWLSGLSVLIAALLPGYRRVRWKTRWKKPFIKSPSKEQSFKVPGIVGDTNLLVGTAAKIIEEPTEVNEAGAIDETSSSAEPATTANAVDPDEQKAIDKPTEIAMADEAIETLSDNLKLHADLPNVDAPSIDKS